GLGFLQKPDDLLFRKALLHVRLLLRKRTLLDSGWPCLQGAGHANRETGTRKLPAVESVCGPIGAGLGGPLQ
ncbi:hypothetical protein QZM03_28695, partial [Burkholderia multivorans]|nr:hypothetical protein [Burkholderia multivorans]